MNIDLRAARGILESEYQSAEELFHEGKSIAVPSVIAESTSVLFKSATQAYREALVGIALARIINEDINIRQPYVNQGEDAFNGRALDEKVVNPFLRDRHIPSSKGPYLSALRRNVSFVSETLGQKDKRAYQSLLDFITELEGAHEENARLYLRYLLKAFIELRERSRVDIADVHRLSVDQYDTLVDGLLSVRSGGLIPVLLAVATFRSISECYELNWNIEWQGINVADAAKGVGGDINVSRDGQLLFSVEVTERQIDRSRVVSTFMTKIAPGGIQDYIFFFTATPPTEEAHESARGYFAQGHEMNFVSVKNWIMTVLTTIGAKGRRSFTLSFIQLLQDAPAALKVAWNEKIHTVISQ